MNWNSNLNYLVIILIIAKKLKFLGQCSCCRRFQDIDGINKPPEYLSFWLDSVKFIESCNSIKTFIKMLSLSYLFLSRPLFPIESYCISMTQVMERSNT